MPENDRGIGSEGLEQGGPQLGNDYTRKDLSVGNAGDALSTPDTKGLADGDGDQDSLSMDDESSRNLAGEDLVDDEDDNLDLDEDELDDDEDDEDDEDDDDDLADLDDDDDDDEETNTF